MTERDVVIWRLSQAEYPRRAPFHPQERYPEYGFPDPPADEPNPAYQAVREALRLAGLDRARVGTPEWNPLGEFIRPGQFVLLKPNLVKESHPRDPQGWVYTLTHGSIVRAVADYVWKALEGRGRVWWPMHPRPIRISSAWWNCWGWTPFAISTAAAGWTWSSLICGRSSGPTGRR